MLTLPIKRRKGVQNMIQSVEKRILPRMMVGYELVWIDMNIII